MNTTSDSREHILDFIVAHGGATVAQLCAAMRLSDATVRRHLDRLAAASLITGRLVHQPTGRPHRLYSATDSGVRSRRDHSETLAARLIRQITGAPSSRDRIAEGLAEQISADHRDQVPLDAPLEQRVADTVEALRSEGILDDWSPTTDGFVMHNHGCPYRSAADNSDCICESDRRAIEKLVGVNVEQVGSLVHGDNSCEFTISAPVAGRDLDQGQLHLQREPGRAGPRSVKPSSIKPDPRERSRA